MGKNFFRKLRKIHYFRLFFKKVNKPCLTFLWTWTKKANGWEILWKFSIIFLWKLRRMHYFSICCKKLTKYTLKLCALGAKTQIVEKFWENFQIFLKKIATKLVKKALKWDSTTFSNLRLDQEINNSIIRRNAMRISGLMLRQTIYLGRTHRITDWLNFHTSEKSVYYIKVYPKIWKCSPLWKIPFRG